MESVKLSVQNSTCGALSPIAWLQVVQQSLQEKELAAQLDTALTPSVQRHTFPKSVVDICCMVLESGGSDLAVAICAASLALADAGIQLYDLVAACSVVSNPKGAPSPLPNFLCLRAHVRVCARLCLHAYVQWRERRGGRERARQRKRERQRELERGRLALIA